MLAHMASETGLRERKKQRTRRDLIEAAARLFEQRGYDETTVAEIAAAVEVSPRTFFSYFPSKEEVLFADMAERVAAGRAAIEARRPGEPVGEVLLRAIEQMMTSEAFTADLGGRLGPVRLRLLAHHPALQAAAMRRLLAAQTAFAEALHGTDPAGLDRTTSAAVVGALLGASIAAATASLGRGDDLDGVRGALRQAAAVALNGITATDGPGGSDQPSGDGRGLADQPSRRG